MYSFHNLKNSPKYDSKCYHYKKFQNICKITQDSGQMFLKVLFYISFESQFMNYWVGFLRNAN